MATMNIHTVLTLFFAIVACEASAIKGHGTGWQTGIPVMTDTQGNTSPPDISRPALPIVPSTQSAASAAGANLPPMPIAQEPASSLPSKPEGLDLPVSTSPKEETPGLALFSMLARIPGYDERCNMQAPTAKARCQSKPGGKKRHRRWYLDPTSKKCLASCDKKAPFRYKMHCDAICRTEKACHFSATGFPCVIKSLHPVFIYNQTQKKCVKGFDCDYYGNKFVTLRECEKTCVRGGLQEAQKQVTITAGMSNEPSNQIPTSVPPNHDLPAPSLPGASFGQVITGNQVAAGSAQNQVTIGGSTSQTSVQGPSSDLGISIQQSSTITGGTPVESTLSSTQSSSQASVPSQSAMSTSGQQQTQTPAAVPSGPAIQVTQVVTEGTQQTAGGAEASSQASSQTRTSISTQGQQPARTPTAVPPGPGPQVPQVDTGGFPPQSTTGAGATSQVSTQTQNSLSIISQQQGQQPSGFATKPGLQGHQIPTEKASSSGATSAPQTTSRSSSSGSPVRRGQVSSGSGIQISPELEIVAAGTGPRRNQVTTESRPSDTSEESLSLDLGLGGPRNPLNIGATSVSRTLNRGSNFGLPPRLGPVSPQSGAIVRPELEIVGVGSGRMRRPPSGPRANRRTTGTGLTSISGKPGNLGVGVAPPRVPSTSGQTENQPGETRVPHIPGETPGAGLVAGQRQPSSPVGAPIVPGLEVPGGATSRGPTISSGTNALITGSTPIPGIHHPGLSVQPGLGGPETTGTSKEGPVKTGTIGPQAPSVLLHPVAPMPQKPSLPLTPPLNQNLPQQPPTTQKMGISEEGPVKTGAIGPQAPSFPVLPVAPVLQTPSLPLTPPLNQNLLQKPPTTQKIGTSEAGPVKTGTSGPQAPSVPLHPFAPMPQKPSLPLTPPLNQNLLQQRPTTQKIGISDEGPVKSGTIGPQAPSLPVYPVAPVPQKPSLPPTPPFTQTLLQQRPTTQKGGTSKGGALKTGTSGPQVPSLPVNPVAPVPLKPNLPPVSPLNQIVIQKRPTIQKIESQIITGSQAIRKGSLNDQRLVKRIQKGGNEGIQMSVSEDELPLPTGPLNEPPLKGFSLTTLPNLPTMAKLPGLLKIKTVRK
ncbi:uncharacterized protein LOC119402064 [Rhipicephalus sanguineus]|uniref:uncharacterized protein LOC119402064 n=1 Tax=Rhipicephalus sanguineus TaxID=34632 RepID=UPI0020C4152F|nr:uncharacterized protein LOC119402064 [Rhipicephalus sanguineus]